MLNAVMLLLYAGLYPVIFVYCNGVQQHDTLYTNMLTVIALAALPRVFTAFKHKENSYFLNL